MCNAFRRPRPSVRLISLFLAMALLMAAVPFRSAAAYRSDIDDSDTAFVHWGFALTASMIASAVDNPDQINDSLLKSWCHVRILRPDKIFILQMSNSEISTVQETLGNDSITFGIAATLAENINRQFSDSYADAARLVRGRRHGSTVIKWPGAAVLVYGQHIVLVTLSGSSLYSSFIISSNDVSAALDETAIRENAVQLGLSSPKIRTYEGEKLDKLLSLDPVDHGETPSLNMWSLGEVSSAELADTAAESAEHMRAILPLIAGDDHIQEEVVLESLYRFVNSHDSMETANIMSQEFLPILGDNSQREYLDLHKPVSDKDLKAHPAPEITWVEESESTLRPDSTFLFVVEKYYPEKDPIIGYDIHLQAALPAWAIPASPEEADYIIRTVATWDGNKYTQGAYEVIYCYMHTVVYDAKTGEKVKNFGTVVHKLNGYMTVSSKITYLAPSRLQIWDQVRSLFK